MANLNPIQLTDWRRTIAGLYADIRRYHRDPIHLQEMRERFRTVKDDLFWNHPMTPLTPEQQALTTTSPFFAYDTDYAVWGTLNIDVEPYTLMQQEDRS